jgi:energy-coupling factor transporter ATP-binding protein EcfA2
MKLLRVQVPNFRALKDVDISFEPDFVPNIFPIGSQNGGGKSTLLQLVFILLHCAANETRKEYLRNLLKHIDFAYYSKDKDKFCTLADIEIELEGEIYEICFSYCSTEDPGLHGILGDEIFSVLLYADENDLIDYLVCNVYKLDENHAHHNLAEYSTSQILRKCSEKIFLLVPGSQIFLFSGREHNRNLLLSNPDPLVMLAHETFENLPGMFNYNFLAVDLLLETFKQARDLDFQKAVETGSYGSNYQELLDELNLLLGNKIVNVVSSELNEIAFYKIEKGQKVTIYPEDLSRGEMQRLSLYVCLKKSQIQDAVILIDEVETALHPDWQYQIVSDLATWGPTNQYLLATHSYELCEALTPAHVKEIPPVLLKQPVANP